MQTRKIKNSPKGNDTENKLHQMLYDYLAITEEWLSKGRTELKKAIQI